jgi:hypothetical protein
VTVSGLFYLLVVPGSGNTHFTLFNQTALALASGVVSHLLAIEIKGQIKQGKDSS